MAAMSDTKKPLADRAFGADPKSRLIVAYQSHQDALRFLASTLGQQNGVALLQGPRGSGKSTILREQKDWLSRDAAVVAIDGANLTPRHLLTGMLAQFDVKATSTHDEHLLQLLNQFLSQQTRAGSVPVLMIDDIDRATPSALSLLNWMAALDVVGRYALRIVLTGKGDLVSMMNSGSMRSIARRHPLVYSMNPMSSQEATIYLRTRHIAAGGRRSDEVFSIDVCQKLHELSGGWPGPLNQSAMNAMSRLEELHSAKPKPRLVISRDGQVVKEVELSERQHLIGRTDLADIVIDDTYVSKMHAMIQVYDNAIVLLDLNSTNGTTVNSRVVQKAVLRSDDIISLGRYRLKIENAPAMDSAMDERIKATDTMTMQNLGDIRRARARRTIKALNRK